MKKLLILALMSIYLSSCEMGMQDTNKDEIGYIEFTYKGHDMVEFKNTWSYGSTIIHSPECRKCFPRYN